MMAAIIAPQALMACWGNPPLKRRATMPRALSDDISAFRGRPRGEPNRLAALGLQCRGEPMVGCHPVVHVITHHVGVVEVAVTHLQSDAGGASLASWR